MRKTKIVEIKAEGRDKGKFFKLTEMPAFQAERWAMRAFLALAKSGVEVPDNLSEMGMAGLATLGLQALSGVSFEDAQPLLDEMMNCVSVVPNPQNPDFVRPLLINRPEGEDIEELTTLFELRKEVAQLHMGFLQSAVASTSETPSPPIPPSPMPGQITRASRVQSTSRVVLQRQSAPARQR